MMAFKSVSKTRIFEHTYAFALKANTVSKRGIVHRQKYEITFGTLPKKPTLASYPELKVVQHQF
jgi:hypothetical protein